MHASAAQFEFLACGYNGPCCIQPKKETHDGSQNLQEEEHGATEGAQARRLGLQGEKGLARLAVMLRGYGFRAVAR